MILLANCMRGVAAILDSLIFMAYILIIGRVIISWVNADRSNKIVQFFVGSTEPMLSPIRKRVPLIAGSIDLSPIILLFGITFFQYALVESLKWYAVSLLGSTGIDPRLV